MRRTTSIILLIAILSPGCAGTTAAEDAGTCYTIADSDARTTCLTRARQDPGMCYAVQRADLRARCLAEMRKS